jgi:hypothetical protein
MLQGIYLWLIFKMCEYAFGMHLCKWHFWDKGCVCLTFSGMANCSLWATQESAHFCTFHAPVNVCAVKPFASLTGVNGNTVLSCYYNKY